MRVPIVVAGLLLASCSTERKPAPPVSVADAAVAVTDASSMVASTPIDAGVDAAFVVASETTDDSTEAKLGAWDVSALSLPEGKSELTASGKVTKMTKHPSKGWVVTVGADTFHHGLPAKMKPAFAVGDEIVVSIRRSHAWHVGLDGSVLDAAGEPLVLVSAGGHPKGAGDFKVLHGRATKTVTEGRKTTTIHEVRVVHASGKQAIAASGESVRRLTTPKGTFVVSGTSIGVDYTSGPIPPETSSTFLWTILRER